MGGGIGNRDWLMGADKTRKAKIKTRMAELGESYTAAMRAVDAEYAASVEPEEEDPAPPCL